MACQTSYFLLPPFPKHYPLYILDVEDRNISNFCRLMLKCSGQTRKGNIISCSWNWPGLKHKRLSCH